MLPLHERVRPASWAEVVGQDKAVALVRRLAGQGLGGRALWITGQSGTGKTTIAKLAAAELADSLCVEELDAGELTVAALRDWERIGAVYGLGERSGRAFIVNEAHGLRRDVVRQLLVVLERIPGHVLWVFTTTNDGQDALFDGCEDAHPLLSRCTVVKLARQGLAKPFAAYARRLAVEAGLDGRPDADYVRLLQDNKNNLRAALNAIEAGDMLPN